MGDPVALVAAVARPEGRAAAARALAASLGYDDLMLFVDDPEVRALLPVPGFPQTLPGGNRWRDLLARAAIDGTATAQLAWPGGDGSPVPVLARGFGGGGVVAFRGGPPREPVGPLLPLLSLLVPGLAAERLAIAGRGHAQAARDAAGRAETVATALTAAQRELNVALRGLREEARRKDEFLAMLGHELRNPLAAITGALHLLQRAPDAAGRDRSLLVAERQARHLARLVDDLLDVSRASLGKVQLRRETVNLAEVASRSVAALEGEASKRRQTVVFAADGPSWVDGDPVRLEQILINVVQNAIKYSDAGGRIEVRLEPTTDQAVVRVTDDGVGIAAELLPHLFDPFLQAKRSLARSEGGLGVGLTLVRSLVGLHGGTVTAHSEGTGRGATFVIRLPRVAAPVGPPPPPPPVSAQSHRILVVDDNTDSAEMLGAAIEAWGHSVRLAFDGQGAVREASAFEAQIVLLDVGLPDIDGYEVAARLRGAKGPTPRLIALTGYGQDEDRARTAQAGFDAHLVKPVELDTLRRMLGEPLEREAPRPR